MQLLLTKIKNLVENSDNVNGLSNVLNDGATEKEIQNLKENFIYPIPLLYIEFLKFSNGCILFKDSNLDGYHILNINEIIEINKMNKDIYEEAWDEAILIFCEIIGEGNYLALKLKNESEYEIIDGFHEDIPKDWKSISLNFVELFEKIIDKNGEKVWFDYYNE